MSFPSRRKILLIGSAVLCGVLVARAELPEFLQHTVSATALESALFRVMELPGVKALYPRPPKEARTELAKLLTVDAQQAELYSMKAREDEQALDFVAAESDWKSYAAHSPNKVQAELDLAAFYHRRLKIAEQVRILMQVGETPPSASEAFTPVDKQQSWRAFSQIVALASENGLDISVTQQAYAAWRTRYPHENAVYANEFNWLLATKQYDAAAALVAHYKTAFPGDAILPTKASALLALRRGSMAQAIAVYDSGFQPLWSQNLIDSYFALLGQAHQKRAFLGAAKARLEKNPDDFDALCRVYFYQLNMGHADAAQAALDQYRAGKDSRKAAWTSQELYTLMKLTARASNWPESARYAFALYNLPASAQIEGRSASEVGLASMTHILLSAPDQPLALGGQNLSMYRDIATVDQGPGYWNGILSLWLNSSSPASELHSEETAAQPYFHRAKAASLLKMLDAQFPRSPDRAALHAGLITVYADYEQNDEIVRAGSDYLTQFQQGTERVAVALQMADAYARQGKTKEELALYDRVLAELGTRAQGMPLTAALAVAPPPQPVTPPESDGESSADSAETKSAAFEITSTPPALRDESSVQYSQVLERYLSVLVSEKQMQSALGVLRQELDRNPNDPQLYERLAQFLEQNKLDAQQEEVYKNAIARFSDKSWYDKLARFYLRQKRNDAYADLTRQVARTFEGTDLESYFRNSGGVGPQMSLQLNLYAAHRFPHDLVFVRNILEAYDSKPTADAEARLALLRLHWWEADDLRAAFFETLSSLGRLDAELQQLQAINSANNPAASHELAELQIWRSHFEESAAPLDTLASLYPADVQIGERAASVFRSLAYFDAAQTTKAVKIEKNLLLASPGDLNRLATIGDIYADAGAVGLPGHEDLAAAEPFWRRMAQVNPSSKDGYLQAATVFWDYFEFDKALEQIQLARKKFGDNTLYGYEAGAIYEGKRDANGAVHEYLAAALADDTEARSRLLSLSTRAEFAPLIDKALASTSNTSTAMTLREDILTAQNRSEAIGPLLESELASAKTVDDVADIATRAQLHKLTVIYEKALSKQQALSSDPVEKMQLQYALVRSAEDRKDIPAAAKVITAVYAQNPKILGVVRATVDFDWRTGARRHAITVLREAAMAARPDLRHQFTLEAATKANDLADYTLARQLVSPLLDAAPYDPQLIAVVADSYGRANDNAGLRDFYLTKLISLKTSSLSPDARKQTALLLRRGLIPALTRMKDYLGAVDQYIAMLSTYPEDQSLTQEAALYALRWQQNDRLIQFLQATVTQSPRDSRFFAMLATVETVFENFPAALNAWTHAVAIRADRQDWFIAKAELELRLNHLDEACADYERLYVLSYKDAQWMVAEAEVRAQQGRKADAIAALQRAYMSGHTPAADDAFEIASRLETWNILDDARTFAEQGLKLSGGKLLFDNADGAATYMKIMTRLRQIEPAIAVLDGALADAITSPNSPSIIAQQVAKQGIASVTDEDWRKKLAQQRSDTARQGYAQAMQAMAADVGIYATPEEKASIAAVLQKHSASIDVAKLAGLAGLKDIEAAQLRKAMQASKAEVSPKLSEYHDLETSRLRFEELGHTLEAYIATLAPDVERESVRQQAAAAYRDAGDELGELRVMLALPSTHDAGSARERLFSLLLRRDQPQLFKFASQNNDFGDAATQFALSHASEPVALQALISRSAPMSAVWGSANRALAGLYFADYSPATDNTFHATLADGTIADGLAHPVDRAKVLAGDAWFYYGMRYGVFRLNGGPGDAEDYIAAELEHASTFASYVELARTYTEANKVPEALTEYGHALELQPDSVSVQDAVAVIQWKSGHHEEAISTWTNAIAMLREEVNLQAAPADFFTNTEQILCHQKQYVVLQLRTPLTALLKAYLAKNGSYRSNELLLAAFDAAPDAASGVSLLIELSAASAAQAQILADLDHVAWISGEGRAMLLAKRIELARSASSVSPNGDDVANLQARLASLHIELKQYDEARSVLSQIPASKQQTSAILTACVLLAAHDQTLPALLSSFDTLPDSAQPSLHLLRNAQAALESNGDAANARVLLEYLFTQGLTRHTLTANDYLALADARLSTNDLPGALDLLRRMTLLPGSEDRFANTDLAASLLETSNHPAEAITFLAPLAAGRPWNADYATRLAEAQMKASQNTSQAQAALSAIASSPLFTYDQRARAASDLHGANLAKLGSRELNLLTASRISPEQAHQPYFAKARVAAAASAIPSQREQLLREAIAIAPDASDNIATRTSLFRVEADLHRDALAVAVIHPLLSGLQAPTSTVVPPASSDATSADGSDADSTGSQDAVPAPAPSTEERSDNAALLAEVADVSWRLGNEAESMQYLQQAVRMTVDVPLRKSRQQTLSRRRVAIHRERINASRIPTIHAALEQSSIVRPRLQPAKEAR